MKASKIPMLMDEHALRDRCNKARYDILRRAKPRYWKTGKKAGLVRVPGIEKLSFTSEDLWHQAISQVGAGAMKCPYCVEIGRPASIITLANYVWDHKVPVARGGTHTLDNLFAVCEDCNRLKGSMSYEFFIALMSEVERWDNAQDRSYLYSCLRTHGVTNKIRFAPKKQAQPVVEEPTLYVEDEPW
jgi:5-methylcytosine-specific restriction endonuclease McrA